MSKNPELASLRQWIFAHNADSRGISISTAASHVSLACFFVGRFLVLLMLVGWSNTSISEKVPPTIAVTTPSPHQKVRTALTCGGGGEILILR